MSEDTFLRVEEAFQAISSLKHVPEDVGIQRYSSRGGGGSGSCEFRR